MQTAQPKEIKIGNSDYSRERLFSNEAYGGWGTDVDEFRQTILAFERDGYKIIFKSSWFRKLFLLGLYKVVAVKQTN